MEWFARLDLLPHRRVPRRIQLTQIEPYGGLRFAYQRCVPRLNPPPRHILDQRRECTGLRFVCDDVGTEPLGPQREDTDIRADVDHTPPGLGRKARPAILAH